MALHLTVGGRALVGNKHPHAKRSVTLLSYGPYGLDILGLVGWLCRADNGDEFYAHSRDLIPI